MHCVVSPDVVGPPVRSLSWRWMDRMSQRANSSSFVTRMEPNWAALSAVRFRLQAMADVPKTAAMVATWEPSRLSMVTKPESLKWRSGVRILPIGISGSGHCRSPDVEIPGQPTGPPRVGTIQSGAR